MLKSPDDMVAAVKRNLKDRTGKTIAEWVRIAKRSKLTVPKDLKRWLKDEHGLGGTTCVVIALETLGPGEGQPQDASEYLDHQFRGDRAKMRPTYEAIVKAVQACGKDVEIGPRKTQTTFLRGHLFAIAKGPTLTAIDLGLRLPGVKPTKRLEATTKFSDNCTHCVRLTSPKDVDAQLKGWLKKAYAARG